MCCETYCASLHFVQFPLTIHRLSDPSPLARERNLPDPISLCLYTRPPIFLCLRPQSVEHFGAPYCALACCSLLFSLFFLCVPLFLLFCVLIALSDGASPCARNSCALYTCSCLRAQPPRFVIPFPVLALLLRPIVCKGQFAQVLVAQTAPFCLVISRWGLRGKAHF